MRIKRVWYSNCQCGAGIPNQGSGRGRKTCDQCKKQRWREYSAARYAKQRVIRQQAPIKAYTYRKTRLSNLRQLIINEKLRRGKCEWPESCPLPEITLTNYHAYDFDHRDPSTKKFMLSKIRGQSEQSVIEEMEKCDVLCAYHHRIRTQRDRHQVLAKNAEIKPQLVLFDN